MNWLEVEQTLVAVTAQRIVELNCPYCSGECSPFCHSSGVRKRASVFELLSGKALEAAILSSRGEAVKVEYEYLGKAIRKGIALGYIKESEYERLVFSHEES
ncbi:hypothetical protein [Neobacillus sp. YIM B06451]|uniref:hypothetical protein n=1 Tax=Neobacillus sp. YIM B06451 TaxID=3070994 RepID=UPI00292E5CBF|nr:hypothetical protein [Neobacillus sp. YIM B06451]